MNSKIELGRVNRLKIDRKSDHGFYLVSKNGEDVLLPNRYITNAMKIGDKIEVFIYKDSEDRLISTTEKPFAMAEEFGYLEVTDIAKFGAFVDWGLPKDLFIPKSAQKHPLKKGERCIFYITYDKNTNRLIGSTKLERYLNDNTKDLQKNQETELIITAKTPLGFKVIVDNLYEGMLYHNEIFEKISIGEKKKGYVKNIRDDGKLDISLQPTGDQKDKIAMEKVLEVLKKSDGEMLYHYKTDSQIIKEIFSLSKKSFKSSYATPRKKYHQSRKSKNSFTIEKVKLY